MKTQVFHTTSADGTPIRWQQIITASREDIAKLRTLSSAWMVLMDEGSTIETLLYRYGRYKPISTLASLTPDFRPTSTHYLFITPPVFIENEVNEWGEVTP